MTPWIVALQAPLSMGFSRQEYWSGLPFPPLGYLPHPGVELRSPALQTDCLQSEPPGKPGLFEASTGIRGVLETMDPAGTVVSKASYTRGRGD